MFYIARDIAYSLRSKIEHGTYTGADLNVTATSYLNTLIDTMANLARGATADTQEKRRKELFKFSENLAKVITKGYGLAFLGTPLTILKGVTKKQKKKKEGRFKNLFKTPTFKTPTFKTPTFKTPSFR